MNKAELKRILKPLIKECIKEVIFEDGTLSTIISEVMKGTSGLVVENKQQKRKQIFESDEQAGQRLQEKKAQAASRRKKMLDAIGKDAYNGVNLFEGTTPIAPTTNKSSSPHGSRPMDGVDPSDPGVDISSLGSKNIWKKLAGN